MDETQDYTRADVYHLAWSQPISGLSSLFVMSGRGIAKVCAAHDIPVPGRGDWQKIDAGISVERPTLPVAQNLSADRVVFTGQEIARRRDRSPDSSPPRTPRTARRRKPRQLAKAAALEVSVKPERQRWAGPKQPTIAVLAAISDWNWDYGFQVFLPRQDDTLVEQQSMDDPYLETHTIVISAFIVKPKKMADRSVRIELKPRPQLDARAEGQVRACPVGEWWSEQASLVGDALIPHHAAATILSALSARKVSYLTIYAAPMTGGRGVSEIYGVELSTTFDPADWE